MFNKFTFSNKVIKFLFLLIITFIFIIGCTIQPTTTSENTQQSFSSFSGATVLTYKALIDKSDLIVLGQTVDKLETFNTARDPDNIHTPHPELYHIGQIYIFSVEKYLKGKGESDIFIVKREGAFSSKNQNSSTIEQARLHSGEYIFSKGTSYILFLNHCCESASGYDIPNRIYYSGAAEPWLFEISSSNQNKVVAKSQWKDSGKYFPALPLTDMINFIENPSTIPESTDFSSYPPPHNINNPESENPYP